MINYEYGQAYPLCVVNQKKVVYDPANRILYRWVENARPGYIGHISQKPHEAFIRMLEQPREPIYIDTLFYALQPQYVGAYEFYKRSYMTNVIQQLRGYLYKAEPVLRSIIKSKYVRGYYYQPHRSVSSWR